jgi:hypothetical protein
MWFRRKNTVPEPETYTTIEQSENTTIEQFEADPIVTLDDVLDTESYVRIKRIDWASINAKVDTLEYTVAEMLKATKPTRRRKTVRKTK